MRPGRPGGLPRGAGDAQVGAGFPRGCPEGPIWVPFRCRFWCLFSAGPRRGALFPPRARQGRDPSLSRFWPARARAPGRADAQKCYKNPRFFMFSKRRRGAAGRRRAELASPRIVGKVPLLVHFGLPFVPFELSFRVVFRLCSGWVAKSPPGCQKMHF